MAERSAPLLRGLPTVVLFSKRRSRQVSTEIFPESIGALPPPAPDPDTVEPVLTHLLRGWIQVIQSRYADGPYTIDVACKQTLHQRR
jgi:hypothetical protein